VLLRNCIVFVGVFRIIRVVFDVIFLCGVVVGDGGFEIPSTRGEKLFGLQPQLAGR
jgi:hypothetical protein